MIRVVYRWRLEEGRQTAFAIWWHDATLRIRSTHPGALGSTLLAPVGNERRLVAVARWRSRPDVEAFWADQDGAAFDGAQLESVEILEELDDLVVSPHVPE